MGSWAKLSPNDDWLREKHRQDVEEGNPQLVSQSGIQVSSGEDIAELDFRVDQRIAPSKDTPFRKIAVPSVARLNQLNMQVYLVL